MTHFLKYNTGRIHYTDKGTGEVIMLLHGYFEISEIWKNFAGKLSGQFRVISVDLPGHGRSDNLGDTHLMEFMADILKELIRTLDIKKVFLTGHSMGGYLTLAFAELFPEMLSGYCLLHSHPFADSPEVLEKREKEIKLALAGGKDLIYPETVKKMYAAKNLEKIRSAFERSKLIASTVSAEGIVAVLRGMMARPSRVSVMEKGNIPCLWILGAMDNFINCEQVRTKVRLPHNAEIAVLENSGHMGFIEEEKKCLEIIKDFVGRHVLTP